MTTAWGAHWYCAAGAVTAARQVLFGMVDLTPYYPHPVLIPVEAILKYGVWKLNEKISLLQRAALISVVLVNQNTYEMMLQVGEEMDDLMEETLPRQQMYLDFYRKVAQTMIITDPIACLTFTNRADSLQANHNAYEAVLSCWRDSWEWITTVVTEVVDGDTIHVEAFDDSVRIEGIDCPEICHEEWDPDCSPDDERFEAGYAAKAYAERLLIADTPHGEQIVALRARKKRDHYGRVLAKVFIGGRGGAIFGNEMVRAGHAKFYTWSFPTTLTH